jgi:3-oxoacyl-[acyl-carrier-protein] synthase-3
MREIALQVLGTGEFVPAHHVESTTIDRNLDKAPGWTFEHTGVRRRAHAPASETVLTMGAAAAREAMRRAGITADRLDLLIAVGSVPAQAIPCTAALLHRVLGLSEIGTAAFDVNATCLGFLAALDLVAQGIATDRYTTVLIVAAERASIGLNQHDASTAGLFGDGAAAIIVGRSAADSALLGSHFQTFSAGVDWCRLRAGGSLINPHIDPQAFLDASYFEMRGRDLYRLVVEKMPGFLQTLLERSGLALRDVDVWVPHQASGHGIRHLQQALDLPADRFVSTLETHGNQVSASLPVALHQGIVRGLIQTGKIVALVGTGAGLSFGGAVLRF